MPGDIDLGGYVFTREEWLELGEDLRCELIETSEKLSYSAQKTERERAEA